MRPSERASTRREPKQRRSRQTVDDVLEAVPRVLRRHGAEAITTNRVAEAAGVSIGSLYQYFPDKQAIFMALHERHVDGVRQVIERTLTDCTSASLEEFTAELAEVTMRAENTVAVVGEDALRMQKLLDVLEDLDDVQAVFHNAEMDS
jgi:AcrR family transcriptional regulator